MKAHYNLFGHKTGYLLTEEEVTTLRRYINKSKFNKNTPEALAILSENQQQS